MYRIEHKNLSCTLSLLYGTRAYVMRRSNRKINIFQTRHHKSRFFCINGVYLVLQIKTTTAALFYTHLTVIVLVKLERHSWASTHANCSYKFLTFWTQNPRDIRVTRGLVIKVRWNAVELSLGAYQFQLFEFCNLHLAKLWVLPLILDTISSMHARASLERWCRGTFGPPVGPRPSKPTAFLGLCSPWPWYKAREFGGAFPASLQLIAKTCTINSLHSSIK